MSYRSPISNLKKTRVWLLHKTKACGYQDQIQMTLTDRDSNYQSL